MSINDDLGMEFAKNTELNPKLSEELIKNKNKNSKKLKIILISCGIIVLIGICILLYFLLRAKDQTKENVPSNEEQNYKNIIIGTYSVKSGQKFQLFNPESINVKEDDYYIENIEENNTLRNLKVTNDEKNFYTREITGEKSFKIIFKINLITLNEIFKDNKELIKVDLSNFEMENVLSMNSSFSGCENLEEVNLEGINTTNLIDMTYTFEKCHNLKKIDLSSINANNTLNYKGIFFRM